MLSVVKSGDGYALMDDATEVRKLSLADVRRLRDEINAVFGVESTRDYLARVAANTKVQPHRADVAAS